jgi:predicted nucleic acid-binding protein
MLNPVLIDASVWIDYFNGVTNSGSTKLDALIGEHRSICICPPVKQEVLQGFRTDTDYNTAVRLFSTLEHLTAEPYEAAIGAAQIFRRLRKQGITIRKSNDCLIAWYALSAKCSILHKDRDYDSMVKPLKLQVVHF